MFDTVRSSYDLGPGFKKELQTKSLDCCMTDYWISPAGQLFEINYEGTSTFEVIGEDDPRYDHDRVFLNYEWIPTGNHGKIKPVYLFHVVEVYPAVWDCYYAPFPRCKIFFKDGIIRDLEYSE